MILWDWNIEKQQSPNREEPHSSLKALPVKDIMNEHERDYQLWG